jgi:hypothetical protein
MLLWFPSRQGRSVPRNRWPAANIAAKTCIKSANISIIQKEFQRELFYGINRVSVIVNDIGGLVQIFDAAKAQS